MQVSLKFVVMRYCSCNLSNVSMYKSVQLSAGSSVKNVSSAQGIG